MKFRPFVSEFFQTDGRTGGLAKLRVVFLNYANAPNNANLHTKGQEYPLHRSEVQNHL
jgi:hypothetical protein